MRARLENLKSEILFSGKIAVALSGGLDSSVLLAFAASVAGAQNCIALTAATPYMARSEIADAEKLCRKLGVELLKIEFADVFDEIKNNPPQRCFLCKTKLFTKLKQSAAERGFSYICDGTNADDLSDYRPGMAALKNLNVASPFLSANMGKADIRALAKMLNLDCAQKSAYACLMTRFECGQNVSKTLLERVDRAEEILRKHGFDGVRVRVHANGSLARIELKESDLKAGALERLLKLADSIKAEGFKFVSLDLCGYSRGNMNGV